MKTDLDEAFDEAFDKDLESFFSGRQEIPAHVKSQIHTKLRTHEVEKHLHLHSENHRWVGIMVLCSVMCMVTLALTGWMFLGQAALWIIGGIYYFLTMGGMVVMLLSNNSLPNNSLPNNSLPINSFPKHEHTLNIGGF